MKVSVIIAAYNEAHTIGACLQSLAEQTIPFELSIVDDGSTDETIQEVIKFKNQFPKFFLIEARHKGPGAARNLGAEKASGEILVFVDSDMTLDKNFLKDLVAPIEAHKTKGTFTKEEYVSNWENIWARCWSYNLNLPDKRRLALDYPDTAPVFRAILKQEFIKVKGYDAGIGWTDDWTLSRKLGYGATVTDATCYHGNPESLREVFDHAQWIGKNEFISGNNLRILFNIFRHSFLMSSLLGISKLVRFETPAFLVFKYVYDFGITVGIYKGMSGDKNK